MVSIDDIRVIERSEWETQTLNDIVHPLTEIPSVTENTTIANLITKLENENLSRIVVLSPAGAVAGIVDKGDIVKILAQKLKLRIAKEDIKRVKEEGKYPPGLNLGAIAKSAID